MSHMHMHFSWYSRSGTFDRSPRPDVDLQFYMLLVTSEYSAGCRDTTMVHFFLCPCWMLQYLWPHLLLDPPKYNYPITHPSDCETHLPFTLKFNLLFINGNFNFQLVFSIWLLRLHIESVSCKPVVEEITLCQRKVRGCAWSSEVQVQQ